MKKLQRRQTQDGGNVENNRKTQQRNSKRKVKDDEDSQGKFANFNYL